MFELLYLRARTGEMYRNYLSSGSHSKKFVSVSSYPEVIGIGTANEEKKNDNTLYLFDIVVCSCFIHNARWWRANSRNSELILKRSPYRCKRHRYYARGRMCPKISRFEILKRSNLFYDKCTISLFGGSEYKKGGTTNNKNAVLIQLCLRALLWLSLETLFHSIVNSCPEVNLRCLKKKLPMIERSPTLL